MAKFGHGVPFLSRGVLLVSPGSEDNPLFSKMAPELTMLKTSCTYVNVTLTLVLLFFTGAS